MILRMSAVSLAVFTSLTLGMVSVGAFAQSADQTITLTEKLQIPEAVLKPGTYTFAVEDRLTKRAIVRITGPNGSKHYLLLAVPSGKVSQAGQDGLVFFQSKNSKQQVLRGWMCPGCGTSLEFVYPKAEAVKITDESTESVLAYDHEYDKLPANLSPDDMKVVSLWILSPERITAKNEGKGVKAAKYSPEENASAGAETAQVSQPPAPGLAPMPAATEAAIPGSPSTQDQPQKRLPKTASNTFSLALWGLLSLAAWAGMRFTRRSRA